MVTATPRTRATHLNYAKPGIGDGIRQAPQMRTSPANPNDASPVTAAASAYARAALAYEQKWSRSDKPPTRTDWCGYQYAMKQLGLLLNDGDITPRRLAAIAKSAAR